MTKHDRMAGLAAYHHPGDQADHVVVALETGDVWEAMARPGQAWVENWLGVLDGGATKVAGHSAPNGTQHLFGAAVSGRSFPLQIGPPHWKWRWDRALTSRHDGIAGLASYFNAGDGQQHLFVALQSGDVWESRFQQRGQVAVSEWDPADFPIGYWFGPQNLTNPAAAYELIAQAGFTLVFPPGDLSMTPNDNRPILAAAGNLNLAVLISDSRIDSVVLGSGATLDAAGQHDLDGVIADYSGHSALAGYFLFDEPAIGDVNRQALLAEVVAYLRKGDPGHGSFINVLPSHAGAGAAYLGSYLSAVRPFVLSFDHYSLLADGSDEPSFFDNLHIAGKAAADSGVPFWQFVLLVKHAGYRQPSEAEKRFEAMQVLAFGGKGVLWFTYAQPGYEGFGPAVVDTAGVPTPHYDEVRRINAEIRRVGRYLLGAKNDLVFENGTLPPGGTPPPANTPVRLADAAEVTAGVFSTDLYRYVLLASRDYKNTVSTTATFMAPAVQRLDLSSDAWVDVDASVPSGVELAPGGAQLFRLLKTP